MQTVRTSKLSKSYQLGDISLEVLHKLDIEIEQGEYVAIMGPSGSGKSTLLNLLGCLDKPTSGSYFLEDEDVSKLDDNSLSAIRGLKIGFIFQSYNLIAQLNVIENIEIPMFYQGVSEHKSHTRAVELAEMVGLKDRLKHRPSELSGGQQQRVAIARALANNPLVILGDEPTGNLDSKSGQEILDILDELHARGKTIIIVTHDEEVSRKAERIIHMRDGYIENIAINHKNRPAYGGKDYKIQS